MDRVNWYLSYELVAFELDPPGEQEELEVWENHVLISAATVEEAYEKAIRHGQGEEEPVKIDEKPGRARFLGLKNLVKIYDELEDGAEIEWRKYCVSKEALDSLTQPKEKFHAFNPSPYE